MKYVDLLRLFALAVPDAGTATDYACEPKDEHLEPVAVRFTYHKKRFRVALNPLHVEQVTGNMLIGSALADDLFACIKAFQELEDARAKLQRTLEGHRSQVEWGATKA